MRTETSTEKNITHAITCNVPWHVTKVKPLEDYKLEVEFVDGTDPGFAAIVGVIIILLARIIVSEVATLLTPTPVPLP